MSKKVPVFSIDEQEEFDRLLKEKDICNLVLFLNHHINEEASLETMVTAVQKYMPYMKLSLQESDIDKILQVLGDASILGLNLEPAFAYFKEAKNIERIKQTLKLGMLYGNWKVVKQIKEYGKEASIPEITLSDTAYKEFFRSKALPFIEMTRDEDGFYIEEQNLESIIQTANAPREQLLKETLEELEKKGSLNTAKKYIFALLTQDPELISKYESEFQKLQHGPRPICERFLSDYLGRRGTILRTLQNGDKDNFFPRSGNIFLVEEEGQIYVAKEHLKQYVDFSRINGYSQEKEILELGLEHPGLPKYLGSIKLEGIEFLKIEFIKGDPLRRFVKQRLPKEKILDILIQTASIVQYLQSRNIIYGDLKDKNLIYDGEKITLIDFGMSRRLEKPITDETFYHSTASTPKYTTPERILTHKVYAKSDVFQLGILAYELLTGQHPFAKYAFKEGKWHRQSSLIKYGISNLYNNFVPCAEIKEDSELSALLSTMLEKQADDRPSISEVKQKLQEISMRYQDEPSESLVYR